MPTLPRLVGASVLVVHLDHCPVLVLVLSFFVMRILCLNPILAFPENREGKSLLVTLCSGGLLVLQGGVAVDLRPT